MIEQSETYYNKINIPENIARVLKVSEFKTFEAFFFLLFFFFNEHAFAISKVKAHINCDHINHFSVCITTMNLVRNVY